MCPRALHLDLRQQEQRVLRRVDGRARAACRGLLCHGLQRGHDLCWHFRLYYLETTSRPQQTVCPATSVATRVIHLVLCRIARVHLERQRSLTRAVGIIVVVLADDVDLIVFLPERHHTAVPDVPCVRHLLVLAGGDDRPPAVFGKVRIQPAKADRVGRAVHQRPACRPAAGRAVNEIRAARDRIARAADQRPVRHLPASLLILPGDRAVDRRRRLLREQRLAAGHVGRVGRVGGVDVRAPVQPRRKVCGRRIRPRQADRAGLPVDGADRHADLRRSRRSHLLLVRLGKIIRPLHRRRARGPLRAGLALWAFLALRTSRTLRARLTLWARWTLRAGLAGVALCAVCAGLTLVALFAAGGLAGVGLAQIPVAVRADHRRHTVDAVDAVRALRALQRPVVDPRAHRAVINVNVIRRCRAHTVGVSRLRRIDARRQRLRRGEKAPDREARAGLPRLALRAGVALRPRFSLRACRSGRTRGTGRSLRTGLPLRAGLALRAGQALLAARALRAEDGAEIRPAPIRQRQHQMALVRDLRRLHAAGDQPVQRDRDRIWNFHSHPLTSFCRRAVAPRERRFVAVRIEDIVAIRPLREFRAHRLVKHQRHAVPRHAGKGEGVHRRVLLIIEPDRHAVVRADRHRLAVLILQLQPQRDFKRISRVPAQHAARHTRAGPCRRKLCHARLPLPSAQLRLPARPGAAAGLLHARTAAAGLGRRRLLLPAARRTGGFRRGVLRRLRGRLGSRGLLVRVGQLLPILRVRRVLTVRLIFERAPVIVVCQLRRARIRAARVVQFRVVVAHLVAVARVVALLAAAEQLIAVIERRLSALPLLPRLRIQLRHDLVQLLQIRIVRLLSGLLAVARAVAARERCRLPHRVLHSEPARRLILLSGLPVHRIFAQIVGEVSPLRDPVIELLQLPLPPGGIRPRLRRLHAPERRLCLRHAGKILHRLLRRAGRRRAVAAAVVVDRLLLVAERAAVAAVRVDAQDPVGAAARHDLVARLQAGRRLAVTLHSVKRHLLPPVLPLFPLPPAAPARPPARAPARAPCRRCTAAAPPR
nr:MAG TPA: hypothetical protein [Caudoviricetes sp.]